MADATPGTVAPARWNWPMLSGFVGIAILIVALIVPLENRIDNRITRLENRIDERFDKVDQRFAKIGDRMVQIEERMGNLEQRMARQEGLLSRIFPLAELPQTLSDPEPEDALVE